MMTTNYELIKKFSELYYDIIKKFIEEELKTDERIFHKISFMEDDFTFISSNRYLLFYGATYYIDIDSNPQKTEITNGGIESICHIPVQFLSDILEKNQLEMTLIYGRYETLLLIEYINFLIEKAQIIVPKLYEIFERYRK